MSQSPTSDPARLQTISVVVVPGHRVASGLNGDARFPGGTVGMQTPFFLALGLDIRPFFTGTLNVSIAPLRYRVQHPRLTLRQVKWHPVAPAEDFSFFDCSLLTPSAPPIAGLVYYPHPATKPEHFQAPSVLELLLPFVAGLGYGTRLELQLPADQILIEPPAATPSRA